MRTTFQKGELHMQRPWFLRDLAYPQVQKLEWLDHDSGAGRCEMEWDGGGELSALTLPWLTLTPPGAMAAITRQMTPRYMRNKGWLLECKSLPGLKKKKDTYFMFAFRL